MNIRAKVPGSWVVMKKEILAIAGNGAIVVVDAPRLRWWARPLFWTLVALGRLRDPSVRG